VGRARWRRGENEVDSCAVVVFLSSRGDVPAGERAGPAVRD
jgi:hypothetical protein